MDIHNKWLEVTNQSDKIASIKIKGVIGGGFFEEGVTEEQVEQDLEAINKINADTIVVDLDSLGGSVKHGLKIHDLLKGSNAKIKVNITGWTASMGTVIAMAADKGELSMSENTQFLIHETRSIALGTKSQIESEAKFLGNLNNQLARIYAERSGISKEEALEIMAVNSGEGEFWSAEEAMERGFVDNVFKPEEVSRAAASVNQKQLNQYHIKATLKNNQKPSKMELNLTKIKAHTLEIVNAALGKLPKEEKNTHNIEQVVTDSIEIVTDSLNQEITEYKTQSEAKYAELEAKYTQLKANSSEPTGKDAYLESDKKPLSNWQKAALAFSDSVSDEEKKFNTPN